MPNKNKVRIAGFVTWMSFNSHRHVEDYETTEKNDVREFTEEVLETVTETRKEPDGVFSYGRYCPVLVSRPVKKTRFEVVGVIKEWKPIFKKRVVTEGRLEFAKQAKERLVLESVRLQQLPGRRILCEGYP